MQSSFLIGNVVMVQYPVQAHAGQFMILKSFHHFFFPLKKISTELEAQPDERYHSEMCSHLTVITKKNYFHNIEVY